MKSRSLWRKRKDVMKFNNKEVESKARQEAALQALHDENVRLGLYDGVYAVETLEQENRLLRARNERLEKRTWVELTDEEIDQGLLRSDYAFKTAEAWRAGVVFAMTKLKEKNT